MEAEVTFLDSKAPHWAVNGLVYLILLVFLLAAVALIVVQVPETVNSPFVLVPTRGADPVRASRSGIVSRVHAIEGQSVSKGEPLFVIQSSPVGDRASELSALETQLRGSRESLVNTAKEYESQQHANNEEARRLSEKIASLTQTIKLKEEQLGLAQQIVQRFEEGFRQGVTSEVELIRLRLDAGRKAVELEESRKDLKEAERSLEKLRHESEARSARQLEMERSLKEGFERARIRTMALEKDLVHTHSGELSIIAPCAGTILRQLVKNSGAFVNEGEALSELACSGETLQAELTLPQSVTGRIRQGHGVKLLYDAFPYQRYGVRYATVRWLSPAATGTAAGVSFYGFADIDPAPIMVDGEPRTLREGMRGTARIVVGRRSLLTYAFEPLRQLKENLSSIPSKP